MTVLRSYQRQNTEGRRTMDIHDLFIIFWTRVRRASKDINILSTIQPTPEPDIQKHVLISGAR